jgi:type III pantothenate kinase
MNLIADIGNTSTKIALYDEGRKIEVIRLDKPEHSELEDFISNLTISKAIISSVRKNSDPITDLLIKNVPDVHILSYKSRLPFTVEYDTPETLGSDRIAAVAGAYALFKGKEILVIDAGTAITYDFISGNIYKGGNISPGLNMRFGALHTFTGKLPLLTAAENYTSPGKNTNDAIIAGVVNGMLFEINEYIRTFEKEHSDFKVILTGGDSLFLLEKIKSRIIHMPDIVIDGLNYILDYNAK